MKSSVFTVTKVVEAWRPHQNGAHSVQIGQSGPEYIIIIIIFIPY